MRLCRPTISSAHRSIHKKKRIYIPTSAVQCEGNHKTLLSTDLNSFFHTLSANFYLFFLDKSAFALRERKKGRKEGRKKGGKKERKEGRKKGRKERRKNERKKGRKERRKEGRKKERKEGRKKEKECKSGLSYRECTST